MKKVAKNKKKLIKSKNKYKLKRKESSHLPETSDETAAENDIEENVFTDSNETVETPEQSVSRAAETEKTEKNQRKKRKIKGKSEHRSEASQNISEFNLTEVGKEKVKLDELIKTSQSISGQVLVKKQLQNAKKLKSLSVPLSKPLLQKIKRTIAYDKVCTDVSKWDTVVKGNRNAEQIVYPLKRPEFHLESFETVSERYISKHPVEVAVSEILNKSENVLDQTRTLTVAEEKALQAMSLEEAKQRHNELIKHRNLISYKEAKARRQNKIKSKRYHRMLKKEKMKQMMKEFEELQKTDQKAALEKFLETDKLRILERMTLKHRNTGKWAKQQKIRARYNPESRSNLKEDLTIGRELRTKVTAKLPSQPKMNVADVDSEDKFFEDISENFLIEDISLKDSANEVSTLDDDSAKILIPEKEPEKTEIEASIPKAKENMSSNPSRKVVIQTNLEDCMGFSTQVIDLTSKVPISLGDSDLEDSDLDDKDENAAFTLDQAFNDDEIINEFREDKMAADKAKRPKGVSLFLPGWGSWGGPSIKASKMKRRRFFIKPLETQPKKNTLGHVIINEEKDKKAAQHQVSHLPFPFSNVNQFESYIRQPIGHTWNPQSSFQSLIAPKVITKMGKIIDPIDSEDVILEKKSAPIKKLKRKKNKPQEVKAF